MRAVSNLFMTQGVMRLVGPVVVVLTVGVSAAAACEMPAHRKGIEWQPATAKYGPTYTASIALSDFVPAKLVCLAEKLQAEYRKQFIKDYGRDARYERYYGKPRFSVLIFSSHRAAACYHGFMDIGDSDWTGLSEKERECASARWSDRQLHAIYEYHSVEDAEYLLLNSLGGISVTIPAGTPPSGPDMRIDLPAAQIPECWLRLSNRCVVSYDLPWYSGNQHQTSTGTVVLMAQVNRRGIPEDITVAETRDLTDRDVMVKGVIDNLKTWRFEPARHATNIRVTYAQVVDPAPDPSRKAFGDIFVDFDAPDHFTIRVNPR